MRPPAPQEVPGQTPETWKSASGLKEHTAHTLLHPGTAAVEPPHPAWMGAGAGSSHVVSRSLPPLDSKLLPPDPHPDLPSIPVEHLSRNAVGSSLSFLGSCKAGIIVLKKLC